MSTHPEPWTPAHAYYSADRPRDHAGLGVTALVLAVLLALAQVASALAAIPLAEEVESGAASIEFASVSALGIYAIAALLTFPLLIAAWIVTGIWLIKAQSSAETLEPNIGQRRARAWALLGWVVPIANLFVPLQFVRDLYDSASSRRSGGGALLGWWWAAWLVGLVGTQIHQSILGRLRGGDSAATVVTMSVILAVVTLVGVALWLLIIREIVRGQQAQARAWRPGRYTGPGWR